ncbi:MAG TPA: 3-dehydroquinate synthase [Casimicrobiaceae bacterium]|nr:3-dehydroquinate synthase [Casimicrobiaceae bacterium]
MNEVRAPAAVRLDLALGARSYAIHIGAGVLEQTGALLRERLPARRAIVITNPIVSAHWLQPLRRSLAAHDVAHDVIVVPDGEAHKSWSTLDDVLTRMLELKVERTTPVIALGGGVIGDLAGFAAAIYQRGIPFVQVPTTLLAQVDSSVGGKTGVNHPHGKNMIGAFHQPEVVVADTRCLDTLPAREFAAGMAEVIKYGAICDASFFDWLERNLDALMAREPEALTHAIAQSCRLKADIVARDERETGDRALLNFGHTFGHAIEAGMGYGEWLHGEAVAAGMVLAARLSVRRGDLPAGDALRLERLVARANLPVQAPPLPRERYHELMRRDKKVLAGVVRFILLKGLGHAYVTADVNDADLDAVLS